MATLHYDKVSDARDNIKTLLDAVGRGQPATVRRDDRTAAVVDADRLRYLLAETRPRATAVQEAGGWWVFIEGLSISADGATLDETLAETIAALRDYSEDWQDHLSVAPNHVNNWSLVQLVGLSTDAQLRDWLGDSTS